MSQAKPKHKFRYRNGLAVIVIVFLFVAFSWWGYYSITQPTTPTTSTTSLGLVFYSNMGNGCLQSNPKTREVFAFYHVTVTESDNIPVQYEATYAMATSVTYSDNMISPPYRFPQHLVQGPVFGTSETFDLKFSLNGTAYGRPNATVVGGPVLITVVIRNDSGQNVTYLASSQSGKPMIFSSTLPKCET